MKNSVVLIGSGPLFRQVRNYLSEHGTDVILLEEFTPRQVKAVIDVETGVNQQKQLYLQQIENQIAARVPIFTSVLHRTATEIASWLKKPERVVGFSPLFLAQMKRIEVSRPLQADEHAGWNSYLLFWQELGKEVEMVGDEPGLVFPRTLSLLVNEAAFALTDGVASAEDIDLAMKKGTNFPFGPLEWADQVGIEQIVAILQGLHREMGDDRYRPAPLLRKMVYAGYLGQAAGRGFYRYE